MELSLHPVPKLAKESHILHNELNKLSTEIHELAVNNCESFIEATECTQDSVSLLGIIQGHVDKLHGVSEGYDTIAESLLGSGDDLIADQSAALGMYKNQRVLLELLELPQLMNSCVRQGMFESAIDLRDHISQVQQRYPSLLIVNQIVKEMQECVQKLLHKILQSLEQDNLDLSVLLQAMGYLRRIDVLSSKELREQFLRCRETWFDAEVEKLAQQTYSDNIYLFLSQLLDFTRLNLFEIVTQYNAIFVDEEGPDFQGSVLHLWASKRLHVLTTTLNESLPRVNESQLLRNLLQQSMSCSRSLGNIGFDFSCLLPAIFETRVLTLFSEQVEAAHLSFQGSLKVYAPFVSESSLTSMGLDISAPVDSTELSESILSFPYLAMYMNKLIEALNNLTLCAPLSLVCDIQKILWESLDRVRTEVITMESSGEYNLSRPLLEVCVPFVEATLARIFPGSLPFLTDFAKPDSQPEE